MSSVRVRWPGVRALEVWDVVTGPSATPLHEVPSPLLPAAVADVVVALREGTAVSASRGPIARCEFAGVVVAGGGAVDGVVAALVARGIEARAASDPLYIAAAGGLAILRAHGMADGVVVDVGQTSIKVAYVGDDARRLVEPRARRRIERPALLDVDGVAQLVAPLAAQLVAQLVAQPVGSLPSAVAVVALPCEIDAVDGSLILGACTYWPEGTRWPGVAGVDALLINDAELAAASVSLERRARGLEAAPALVLTIGFGVGAALLLA